MSSEIAALEADKKEYQTQLDTVNESLLADSQNTELQALKKELEDAISITEDAIADIRPVASVPAKLPTPEPTVEKWSKANHPAFQPGYKRAGAVAEPAEELPQAPAELKVNDMVMAKWLSGDKAFYQARIISITGSKADPVYTVAFKAYNNSETVRSSDIRAIANESRKRKAESGASTPSIPNAPTNANVISAAANINPDLVRKEPSKVSDGPPKAGKPAKKIKNNKELETAKGKWQDFAVKGKIGKSVKKESMFRTGEGVTARVGFVGSGQNMRKDPTKVRHVYGRAEEQYD